MINAKMIETTVTSAKGKNISMVRRQRTAITSRRTKSLHAPCNAVTRPDTGILQAVTYQSVRTHKCVAYDCRWTIKIDGESESSSYCTTLYWKKSADWILTNFPDYSFSTSLNRCYINIFNQFLFRIYESVNYSMQTQLSLKKTLSIK